MAPKSTTDVYVAGVGLTKFLKPRRTREYPELGYEAGVKAMLDAGITYDDVETGIACYCYGDTTSGQRVFYQFGMSTIPIYNTNNACATGSTGLHLARTLIRNGAADCILVIGMEQMSPGSIKSVWSDRPSPMGLSTTMMEEIGGKHDTPRNAQYFANAGQEYMDKYGATAEDFAEIARISHEHSQRNPYAQFQNTYTLDEILKSPMVHPPLTKLQCSPTSDGAGAAVLISQAFLDRRPQLKQKAILIAGQSMLTDSPQLFSRSAIDLVGFDMTKRAAKAAMAEARVSPADITVCELHDCFSTNELLLIDGLGFSAPGKAHELVRRGDITYGGKGPVVNPSGGLISKGHPLGATGLAQCAELVWQLRGWANNGRLVKQTSVALQHNLGLGGAVVVNVYKRADGRRNTDHEISDAEIAESSGLGYNPATQAKVVTPADGEKVRSRKFKAEYAMGDTVKNLQSRL
ncbi:acetyl-CoA acetyltransferase [Pseudovirgaria hyperparasitica]|uniref:propanoyl-CoA C-acyltransferase n=1 Tax=Pseudovirgaria hyperparasitica TaxID=470096 RepID=A0A6A6WKV7_9PEZI|nr:acetyl-CoA acetyltransferase [Pseudovirgaria hyperparasitica]KAF2762835.1 acetyl-CoA acetyltransferase [Pseudovirgaria hyperparasitica]